MPITLPDLKNAHCVSVVACGEIQTHDRALIKWLKGEKRVVANFAKKTYVRVSMGEHTGKHFHVDITKQSFFPSKLIPASGLSADKLQKKFERVIGKKVTVDLKGRFEIKVSDLPENGIIKSLFFQTQIGDVALKIKGSRLSIKGAPVNEISWQMLDDGKTIGVVILSENLKTEIAENYLTSALETLEKALAVFVLGKLPK